MTAKNPTAIPEGSNVLVTGATSYVASYVIKDLLERGFHVYGVVRSLSQATWLTEEVFSSFAERNAIELVQVPDLTVSNAFDTVLETTKPSAIIHIATPFNFSPVPTEVIPQAVGILMGILRSASKVASVKRFVYTSSIGSGYSPRGGVPAVVTKDSWNDAAVEVAWSPPPYEPLRGPKVYAASKVEAERAMFRFVEEENPGFAVSTVNPFVVLGPALHKRHLSGTGGWIRNVSNGEPGLLAVSPPSCFVHVQDVAALHVAATLDPDVNSDRLFAWAGPMNLNMILECLRRRYPDRQFMDDIAAPQLCLATIGDEARIRGLLKKWGARDDWISLEQTVEEGMKLEP